MHNSLVSLLLLAVTAVYGQQDFYCNGGTSANPSIRCKSGQYVYCCVTIGEVNYRPDLKQGFPIHRTCGTNEGRCSVKNNAGNDLYGTPSCC
ncbi:uncharacterized protein EKO05_0003914 [Ascochyta rabiei]|uniref:uncharacterized protein n=1 Tax=Didymella rabiei TaxID=5454 RepID=UPI00220A9D2D|nr:uncharacterized protein EKO05_0003914 [Ascochyta rabiei]UPX13405.1 hypothetical protein EKO05_0003914 [Ascochyta rabiei]